MCRFRCTAPLRNKEDGLGNASPESDARPLPSPTVMAASIWDLEELVINILRWLPPAALLAARLVCKQWNTIVLSHRSYISKPCCYLQAEGGRLFDPELWAWVRVSLPMPSAPGVGLRVLPSNGNPGLVAFDELYSYELERPSCYWVGNPMTNAWKFVPGTALISEDSVGRHRFQFVVVSEGPPVRYKIVAFGESPTAGTDYFTVIYDSATGSGAWDRGSLWTCCPRCRRTVTGASCL